MPSYSPVFSAAFLNYTPEAPNTAYEVPAGFTAVVRQVCVYQEIGAFAFALTISDNATAPNCVIDSGHDLAVSVQQNDELRAVVPAGGFIQLFFSSVDESLNAYVGGYLLRNSLT